MELLRTYSLNRTASMTYSLTFEIPDNCNYKTAVVSGKNVITIELNKGQTTPSAVYVANTITPSIINNIICVDFEQEDPDTGLKSKKPKIRVDSPA